MKVGIVGAGSVGATIAYACQIRGVAQTIAIYDIDEKKTRAEVLDRRGRAVRREPGAPGEHAAHRLPGHRRRLPVRAERGQPVREAERVLDVPLSDRELAGLRASADEVRSVARQLGL